MEFTQYTENEKAQLIIVHEPSYEVFMSMLHPAASLYQDVTCEKTVKEVFNLLSAELKKLDIKLVTVRECLKLNRDGLIALAGIAMTYECANIEEGKNNPEFLYYISNDYKKDVLSKLNDDQLVDVVLTRPTYTMKYVPANTYVEPVEIRFRPLGNLLFARDQQITTQKGVVIGRTSAWSREMEHNIMIQVFENLGVKILGEVPPEAYLEGGDFYVLKPDLSIVGLGMRTNLKACGYLMENDFLGTDRFALVIDENDFTQQRMHLDTFFNILDPTHVLCLDFDDLEKHYGRPISRSVHIYTKRSSKAYIKDTQFENEPSFGEYVLNKKFDKFYDFLESEGFKIIKCNHEDQSKFMINFLNVGDKTIISVNPGLQKIVEDAKVDVRVDIINIKFEAVTKMFGAVHCTTQVCRKPRHDLTEYK